MGHYVNPGNVAFARALNSEIYIDKTKSDFCRQQENQLTYDKERGEAFIPNREIIQEFLRSIKTGGWDGLAQALARSEELLRSREL